MNINKLAMNLALASVLSLGMGTTLLASSKANKDLMKRRKLPQ